MKVLIFSILLLFCISCGKQNTQNSDKNVVQTDTLLWQNALSSDKNVVRTDSLIVLVDTLSMLQLNNKIYSGSDYKVLELYDLDSQGYDIDSTRRIELTRDNKTLATISLPTSCEVNNFGIDTIMETKSGFRINVSWGGGNWIYTIDFYFVFKNNQFYLNKVKHILYRQNLDKEIKTIKKINPPILMDKFDILQYL